MTDLAPNLPKPETVEQFLETSALREAYLKPDHPYHQHALDQVRHFIVERDGEVEVPA